MLSLTRRTEIQHPAGRPVQAAQEPRSILGPGVTIDGVLEIDGELVIGGQVRGRIAAVKVVIAETGNFVGDIVAREVVIAGKLNGRVFAPNVSIEASAHVEGRLFHTQIAVAQGARLNGRMPWRPVSYFETLDQLPEIRE